MCYATKVVLLFATILFGSVIAGRDCGDSASDSLALLAIAKANPNASLNWSPETPLSRWNRLVFAWHSTGKRVTKINLTNVGVDTLPEEIELLSQLKSLYLDDYVAIDAYPLLRSVSVRQYPKRTKTTAGSFSMSSSYNRENDTPLNPLSNFFRVSLHESVNFNATEQNGVVNYLTLSASIPLNFPSGGRLITAFDLPLISRPYAPTWSDTATMGEQVNGLGEMYLSIMGTKYGDAAVGVAMRLPTSTDSALVVTEFALGIAGMVYIEKRNVSFDITGYILWNGDWVVDHLFDWGVNFILPQKWYLSLGSQFSFFIDWGYLGADGYINLNSDLTKRFSAGNTQLILGAGIGYTFVPSGTRAFESHSPVGSQGVVAHLGFGVLIPGKSNEY